MIIVTARIFTDQETLRPLYARLKSLCEPSRAEEGCLFYHMAMEDEEEGIIMAMEGWTSRAALEQHLALPSIAALLAEFGGKYQTEAQIHEVSSSETLRV